MRLLREPHVNGVERDGASDIMEPPRAAPFPGPPSARRLR